MTFGGTLFHSTPARTEITVPFVENFPFPFCCLLVSYVIAPSCTFLTYHDIATLEGLD